MIGIYGGTFDPVHFGHLRTAIDVRERLGLSEIRFIPCRVPPHRGLPGAGADDRLKMLELALTPMEPSLRIDRRELDRDGPSYMVDTLRSIRDEIGDVGLYLIVGLDAFLGLPRWHRAECLPDLANVVVMHRASNDHAASDAESDRIVSICQHLGLTRLNEHDRVGENTHRCAIFTRSRELEISATDIRQRLKENRSVRYLLPELVRDYIERRGLYRD